MTTTVDELNAFLSDNEMVIVNLWAGDSEPVTEFKDTFVKVSSKHQDIKFCDVDLDMDQEMAETFDVDAVPVVLVFKEKTLVLQQPGCMPEEVLDRVISVLRTIDMKKERDDMSEAGTHSDATVTHV